MIKLSMYSNLRGFDYEGDRFAKRGDRVEMLVMLPEICEYPVPDSVLFVARCDGYDGLVASAELHLVEGCERVYSCVVNFNTVGAGVVVGKDGKASLFCELQFAGKDGAGESWERSSRSWWMSLRGDLVDPADLPVEALAHYATTGYVDSVMAADKAVAVEAARVAGEAKTVAVENAGLSTTEAQKAIGAASEAKAAKVTAAGSASSASGSASAAETSALNAKASEVTAKQSETNALSAKESAQTAASGASGSATVAGTKATEAAGSASSASGSASAAETSESNAKASEGAAKQSETNALSAKESAQTAASGASGSATVAGTKATEAAGSASSASGSASAAETSALNAKASEVTAKQSETNALSAKESAQTAASGASGSAAAAGTKAAEAAGSASSASGSASAAKTSETNAKASEAAANNSATVAATKANEAAASALGASNALNTLNGQKGQAYGVATLDATSRVPASQLPSYVDDVQEYSARANFPSTGETGKLYVATDSNKLYRWTGNTYIEVTSAPIIVTDNLNSSSPTDALSANQGRLLSNSKLDFTHNSSSTSHSDMRSQMASLVNASVPIGGTTGQVLVKHSDIDNDVRWDTPQSGGGGGLPSSLVSTTPNGDHYGNLVYKTYCAYNTSDESATNGPALFQIEMGPGSGGTQTACIAISSSLGFYGVYFNIGFEANSEYKLNPYDLDTGKIYLRRGYDTAFNYEDCLMASVDGDLMWRGKVISDSSSSGRLKAFHFGGGYGDYINLSKLVDVYYPGNVNSGAAMTISIPPLSAIPAPPNQQMNIYDFEVILCDGDIDSITQWRVSNPDTTDTKSTRLIWVGTSSPAAPPPFPAGYIHTIKGRFFRTSAFDYYRDNTVILQLVSSAKISS